MTLLTVTAPGARRKDIQGLRGIAVASVLIFHAAHPLLPGGFTGVDIFFVISGYLISQILLKALETHQFSLRAFYLRRVTRLFPALYTVLAATLALALLILPPRQLSELAFTQFFTTVFLSNFVFARLTDYFDSAASLKPLLHTWSLGVEEQFYLIYPLVFLGLWRFARSWLWPVLAMLAILSLWAAISGLKANGDQAFYMTGNRAFELLIGALSLLAQKQVSLPRPVLACLSPLGLVFILVSLTLLTDKMGFPGVAALLPCLGTALVLIGNKGVANRLLEAHWLVWTGDLSYSLYLWHWPLLVFAHIVFGDTVGVSVGALALSLAAAWATRTYIEVPFLRGFDWTSRHVWRLSAGLMVVSLVTAALIFAAKGLPARFSPSEQQAFAASEDYSHQRKTCHVAKDARIAYDETCLYGPSGNPEIAIWGDSAGAELADGLARVSPEISVRQITASACPPALDYISTYNRTCHAHNADMLSHLASDPRIQTVILVTNFQRYEDGGNSPVVSGLEQSALALKRAGKAVILMYPFPVYSFDPPSQVGLAIRFGRDPVELGMSRQAFDQANGATVTELDKFTRAQNIARLLPTDTLCDDRHCYVYTAANGVLYFNNQHLSLTGAGLLARHITSPDRFPRAK